MFKNLVVLITGGASGLGRAAAERLAAAEAKVVICDLPNSNGVQVAKTLGSNVAFKPLDVTNINEIDKVVSEVQQTYKEVNVLVNCAGISLSARLYDTVNQQPHSVEAFRKIIEVNTLGTFNVIRTVASLMHSNKPDEEGGKGVVITTSGISAFDGKMGDVACAASHGALASMTLPMARDLSNDGIRVVCIAPGLFDTAMTDAVNPKVRSYWESRVLFPRRLGRPSEYASLVEHIIQNRMLNAEVIRLDAGIRMF